VSDSVGKVEGEEVGKQEFAYRCVGDLEGMGVPDKIVSLLVGLAVGFPLTLQTPELFYE
jgi:hypothetical protein